MHHSSVSLYLQDLVKLITVPSALGRQLQALENGTYPDRSSRNTLEDALIRLADRHHVRATLTMQEIRVLLVYYHAIGGIFETLGSGGAVLDRWATGANHEQAAKLLGIGGRDPAGIARRRLVRAQRKLWHGAPKGNLKGWR